VTAAAIYLLLDANDAKGLYEAAMKRFAHDPARPGHEARVRALFSDPEAFLRYYGFVSETDSPGRDLRMAVSADLNVRTRIGQPIQGLLSYPLNLSTDADTAAPWARAFLPRKLGRTDETRPSMPAFGKVRLMFDAGVPAEYAAAVFGDYSGPNIPAHTIIEMWRSGIEAEYAAPMVAGRDDLA
jgi:hypothetical protein